MLVLFSACAGGRGPETGAPGAVIERGVASWYGGKFHGRDTASGERYDMHRLTAAHKTLPFGTVVEVRNLENGRSVRVRITDRGPFVRGRIIDLSYAAAREIDMVGPGTARVELALVRRAGPVPASLPEVASPAAAPAGGGSNPTPEAGPAAWTVQVGAFEDRERARTLRDLLARHYPEAEVRSDGRWHRVQVGRFGKERRAERLRQELGELGWEAVVVRLE